MDISNQVRGYAFLFGLLRGQQADPFCSGCNAFVKVLDASREGITALDVQSAAALGGLSQELARLFADTREGLASLAAPGQTVGQKKAGNCKMPEGVCFLKTSLALIQKI